MKESGKCAIHTPVIKASVMAVFADLWLTCIWLAWHKIL